MLVDEHCEALTADIPRFYPGLRLADLFTGRLSYYELAALITHLPIESAYRTARRDEFSDEQLAQMSDPTGPHGPWSRLEMLIGALLDAIQALTYVQISRGGVTQDPPEPVRRPGVVTRRRGMSPQEIAYLDRIRELNREQREADSGS